MTRTDHQNIAYHLIDADIVWNAANVSFPALVKALLPRQLVSIQLGYLKIRDSLGGFPKN